MVFKKIIFQNRYVELETPPLHGKIHLKFPFWLLEHLPNTKCSFFSFWISFGFYMIVTLRFWNNFVLAGFLICTHRWATLFYPTKFIEKELWLHNLSIFILARIVGKIIPPFSGHQHLLDPNQRTTLLCSTDVKIDWLAKSNAGSLNIPLDSLRTILYNIIFRDGRGQLRDRLSCSWSWSWAWSWKLKQ